MPEKLDFKLSKSELLQVAEAIHADMRLEVRKHARAIQLLANGQKPTDVAKIFAVQPVTIYNWFHRFRRDGYEGLADHSRGHPKPKADHAYRQSLEAAIMHEPGDYGYAFITWTVERLQAHLEKSTGVNLSVSRLRMLIRKQDYFNQHPSRGLISSQDQQSEEQTQDSELVQEPSDSDLIASALSRTETD